VRRLRSRALVVALALSLTAPETAAAHGLGGIRDLPVPGWLFLIAGSVVLVVSFGALGLLWKEPKLVEGNGRPLPGLLQLIVLSPLTRFALQAIGLLVFVVVWSAAAFGTTRASSNLAPTFVYVIFWVGMAVLVVLVGNVWSALNPWRATADLAAWAARRLGIRRQVGTYPAWLGIWPAGLLLLAFVVLELVYDDPANPRSLALAILVYSIATWSGMLAFGREAWTQNGDGFSVYFGYLSRISLFGLRKRDGRREAIVRQPLSALAFVEKRPGAVAFLAIMLGSVAFDGFSQSTWWRLQWIYDLKLSISDPDTADLAATLVNLGGLALAVLFVALVYTLAVRAAERVIGGGVSLTGIFVSSLIPIAFVYALSHYFSFLVVQSQFAVPLASDPWGKGWDLFGTDSFEPRLDVLSPNAIWYVQVTALVLGHVAGLAVAHDRAVAQSPSARVALRTQYAMLALMVLYTVGGMWLLSIG
jgi:hypothetical protein